jgi:hypothetical protein
LAKPFCSLFSDSVVSWSQGENGLLACECLVHQVRAIAVQARQQANPLRNTFRCLEHGMEVVFVQQLGAAVVQHFRMDDAAFQRGLESSRAGASGIKRRGLVGVPDLAVFAHVETGEGKDDMRVCRILCKRTIHRRREPACPQTQ